jgi:ABC-type antimicrobial peptide transport system permease subunit
MSLSSLFLAAFVTFAFTQLAIEQHTALMALYDAVGAGMGVAVHVCSQ